VGLSSKRAGAFTFGRNWTPFWESLIGSDASGWSNFGSLNNLSYQTRTGLTGAGYYWANNSVKYQTPSYAGLRASVLYSFGGKAGDFQNSRLYSAALSYANGPIGLHAGYLDANDPTGASDRAVARAYNLGAVYHFAGASRAGVSWTHYANPATGTSQDYAAVTGSWGVTAATVLTAACVHLTDRDDSQRNATLFKLGADHFLSKRTALYVDVGYVKNKSRGTLGLQNVVPAGRAGVNQFGLLTGVRTVF
jgi:GBP family porin